MLQALATMVTGNITSQAPKPKAIHSYRKVGAWVEFCVLKAYAIIYGINKPDRKDCILYENIYMTFKETRTNVWWQKAVWGWAWGQRIDCKGHVEFLLLIVLVAMWLNMFAKTHWIINLTWCILFYINYTVIKITYGICDTYLYGM